MAVCRKNPELLRRALTGLSNRWLCSDPNDTAETLRHALMNLKDDKVAVLSAIQANPKVVMHASARLKDDEEIVLSAVKLDPEMLIHASERFKNDKVAVLSAIQANPKVIEYASARLKDDEEIVLFAVKLDPEMLIHASKRLRWDRYVFMAVCGKNPELLRRALTGLLDRSQWWCSYVLRHARKRLKDEEASLEMQSHVEVVFALLHQHKSKAMTRSPAMIWSPGWSVQSAVQEILNSNEMLLSKVWQELPDAFTDTYIFRVALLSGRSCLFVLTQRYGYLLHARILQESIRLLGLNIVAANAELVKDSQPLSDDDSCVQALKLGELQELQLLLSRGVQ